MSTLLQWSDQYSVKVVALDAQHKKLFAVINELHEAMRAGRGKELLRDILDRLVDYTVQHFSTEEKLMERHSFPGLAAHRKRHQELTSKVLSFKQDFEEGNTTITLQLMTFLQDWLRHHIRNVDQEYSDS